MRFSTSHLQNVLVTIWMGTCSLSQRTCDGPFVSRLPRDGEPTAGR